jgi:excisionase family DNA binding protein
MEPTRVAAARLRVTAQTVRDWLRAGRLDGQKVGDRWLVDEASIAAAERERGQS